MGFLRRTLLAAATAMGWIDDNQITSWIDDNNITAGVDDNGVIG